MLLLRLLHAALALNNGVGITPALGWNSWNFYRGALDEQVVRDTAHALVSSGLAQKGYVYVNMDDMWMASSRNASGYLVADPAKFKAPLPSLISDVHAQGLKFGIYVDVGYKTCQKLPGTLGYETNDAELFASWRVDFVKSDSCYTGSADYAPADGAKCWATYQKFAAALNASGRSMVHSIKGPCGKQAVAQPTGVCSPGDSSAVANLRRVAGDVQDTWGSMLKVLDFAASVANVSKPGYFGDLDMLEIGNGGLSEDEERSVMALWCAAKSPLLLGNDVSNMSAATLAIVGNEALLAVNQDALGIAARRFRNSSNIQLWGGALAAGHYVVVALNAADVAANVAFTWADAGAPAAAWDVTDLWGNNVTAAVPSGWSAWLPPHASVALRLENKNP